MQNDEITLKATKQRTILAFLRNQIVGGSLPSGSQIPTRQELADKFQASMVTVQAALDRLSRDGFVTSRQRAGTFVVEHPPHLFEYGLVFPDNLGDPKGWGNFWRALLNESLDPPRWKPRRLKAYRGVNNRADNEVYQQLLADVRAHRLAGLIFPSMPGELCSTSLLEEPSIPMVAVMEPMREFPSVHALYLDGQRMIEMALDACVAAGRKRLAMFVYADHGYVDRVTQAATRRGLEVRPWWAQRITSFDWTCAHEVAHLLMHAGQDERPDAVFVSDDNLLEHVSAGFVAAGVNSPRDVTIVSHCNFPWPTPSALPVQRVGYDVRDILNLGIEVIDRMRRGESVPSSTIVAPVTEQDVEARARK